MSFGHSKHKTLIEVFETTLKANADLKNTKVARFITNTSDLTLECRGDLPVFVSLNGKVAIPISLEACRLPDSVERTQCVAPRNKKGHANLRVELAKDGHLLPELLSFIEMQNAV